MTIWAYEELAHGVNWFRHGLGFAYIASTGAHLAVALGRSSARPMQCSRTGWTCAERSPADLGVTTLAHADDLDPYCVAGGEVQGAGYPR